MVYKISNQMKGKPFIYFEYTSQLLNKQLMQKLGSNSNFHQSWKEINE